MNINIVVTPLPPHVKAITTPNEDGTYTIIVNERLSRDAAIKEIIHELKHIKGNDFGSDEQATLLEEMVRRNAEQIALDNITFFYHYVSA